MERMAHRAARSLLVILSSCLTLFALQVGRGHGKRPTTVAFAHRGRER